MKVTNQQVLGISNSLAYLSVKETDEWYNIGRNINMLKPILEKIDESKKLVIDKYAKKGSDGKYVLLNKEKETIDFQGKEKEVDSYWNKILNEEVDVNLIELNYNSIKDIKLNSNIMKELFDIIKH